jgi:hypothetical protein
MQTPSGVPKRTERIYRYVQVRYKKGFGTCRRVLGWFWWDWSGLVIEVEMDMKIVSVANMRLHWAAKARLTKSQRQKTRNALAAVAQSFGVEVLPVTVVLTRVAPRRLDGDNLQSGFKAVRDGVADWLGVDDGSSLVDWQYAQRSDGPKVYKVEIEVIG